MRALSLSKISFAMETLRGERPCAKECTAADNDGRQEQEGPRDVYFWSCVTDELWLGHAKFRQTSGCFLCLG